MTTSVTHIPATGGGTFPIATAPCTLVALAVNTPGSGSVITLYDNGAGKAQGPVLAVITCPTSGSPFSLPYNLPCDSGLVAAIATADSDLTFITEES
jgi:hypothetical protein